MDEGFKLWTDMDKFSFHIIFHFFLRKTEFFSADSVLFCRQT